MAKKWPKLFLDWPTLAKTMARRNNQKLSINDAI